tara:strand:- start:35 stop:625 length:591 start_codon:yes stop_codon:yes gene_type:complete
MKINFKKYKLLILLYILVVAFIVLISYKEHKKQDTVEHFNESIMLKNQRKKKYSHCKDRCEIKYNNKEDVNVCKSYCKCKKKCRNDKNCKKDCEEIKLNIYRNDPHKLERKELKNKIKGYIKNEKRDRKKEKKKELLVKKNEVVKKEEEKNEENVSFVDEIINKHLSEYEKDQIIETSDNIKLFLKDCKKVLRIKK